MGYTNSPLVSYTNKSPNHSGLRTHSIDRITPHCVVGQCSIESLGNLFAQVSRQASSNYGIGVDGRVGLFVDESNRSWCSSSNANDQRAITIECASDATAPYAFNTTVYNKLIDLCTDICKRNGKTKLLWLGDKDKTLNYTPKSNEMILTVHRWFANKSCPGDWMYARMSDLANKVTSRLSINIVNKFNDMSVSLKGSTDEEKVWNYLINIIKNPYGVAGLMGNIQAESGFKSTNLQNTYEKKLGYTDESYTKAVDDGSYNNFIHDSAGYGLVQWTYWSLKEYLYNYAKKKNTSIGDLGMQLECLCTELKSDYSSVWNTLLNAKTVLEASNAVLLKFERPADQSTTVQNKRSNYGTTILNKYYKGNTNINNGGGKSLKYSRSAAANLINSWVGKKESDGSHKFIIDIYNTQNPLPRGYKVKYTDAWCATCTSAVAIKLGYTDIIPIECSVYYLIEIAKKMGIWQENDSYVPKIGDLVCYDWDDGANYASGNNMNAPDHVGMVTYVNKDAGYFVVTEGNYSDSVKKRTVSINGRYIRGFICPKYDDESSNSSVTDNNTTVSDSKKDDLTIAREVIAGVWGTGIDRKNRLEAAGYNYTIIQKLVNNILNGNTVTTSNTNQDQNQPVAKKVTATASARSYNKSLAGTYTTTADLHLRNDAGTNKKSLVIIPKNTKVNNYGYYTSYNGYKWLYIQVIIDGIQYTGFSHSSYLVK